jgi:hypothetical protein
MSQALETSPYFFVVPGWRGGGLQPPPQTGGMEMSGQEMVEERKDLIVFQGSQKIVYVTFYRDADDRIRYVGGRVEGEIAINLPEVNWRLVLRTTRQLPKIRDDEIADRWEDLVVEACGAVNAVDKEMRAAAVALQEIFNGLRRLQQLPEHSNLIIKTAVWRYDTPEDDC